MDGATVDFATVSTTDPTADDMRVIVSNQGSVTVLWEVFLAGTTTRPTEGEATFTIADLDGTGGIGNTIETVEASFAGLSSYVVQDPTNQLITNTGTVPRQHS